MPINEAEELILTGFSDEEPRSIEEAASLVNSTYWTVYPKVKTLEKQGYLIRHPLRIGRKDAYVRQNISRSPRLCMQGRNKPSVSLWDMIRGAQAGTKNNVTKMAPAAAMEKFPTLILEYYDLVYRAKVASEAGDKVDRKDFLLVRNRIQELRTSLENWSVMLTDLLMHPAFGNNLDNAYSLLFEDPEQPLSRDKLLAMGKLFRDGPSVASNPGGTARPSNPLQE